MQPGDESEESLKPTQILHTFLHSVGVENSTYSERSALLTLVLLTSHSVADVIAYMPDAQCDSQDVVSGGCPQHI